MLNKIYKGQDHFVAPNDKTRVNRNYLETYKLGSINPITTVSQDGTQTMYINPEYYGSINDDLTNKLQQTINDKLQQEGIPLEEVIVTPQTYTPQERTTEYLSTPAPGKLGEQGYVYNPYYMEMPWWKELLSDYNNYYDHYFHEKYINPAHGQYPIFKTIPTQYVNQNGELAYFDGLTMYDENGNKLFDILNDENNNNEQAIITNNNNIYTVIDPNATFDDNGKLITTKQFDKWNLTMTDHLNAAGIDTGNLIAETLAMPTTFAEPVTVITTARWAPKVAKWMPKMFNWIPKAWKNFTPGIIDATFEMYPSLPKYGVKVAKLTPKVYRKFPMQIEKAGRAANWMDNTYRSYLFPNWDMDIPEEWKNWNWNDWSLNGLANKGFTVLNTLTVPSDIINMKNPYNLTLGINGMAKAANEQVHEQFEQMTQPTNTTTAEMLGFDAIPDENGNIQIIDENNQIYNVSNKLMQYTKGNKWITIDGKLILELDENGNLLYQINE